MLVLAHQHQQGTDNRVVLVVVEQIVVQEEVHHPQLKEMRVELLQDLIKIRLLVVAVEVLVAQVVVVLLDLVLVDMVD